MNTFVKEMEVGSDIVDIFKRTETALEAAGAEQLPELKQCSVQSCHFPPVRHIGTSSRVAAAAVHFPPSALQSPAFKIHNSLMEGLIAATGVNGEALQGTPQILHMPPVSPFPFVFVAGTG